MIYNIAAAGAVDREFLCVYRRPLNSLLGARASFGSLWDAIGPLLSLFGGAFGSVWDALGRLRAPFGSLWFPLGRLGVPSGSGLLQGSLKVEKVVFRVHETTVWYNEPDQADQADQAEVVAASAPRTLPSTRAGGQDDVSS